VADIFIPGKTWMRLTGILYAKKFNNLKTYLKKIVYIYKERNMYYINTIKNWRGKC